MINPNYIKHWAQDKLSDVIRRGYLFIWSLVLSLASLVYSIMALLIIIIGIFYESEQLRELEEILSNGVSDLNN